MKAIFNSNNKVDEQFLKDFHGDLYRTFESVGQLDALCKEYDLYAKEYYGSFFTEGCIYEIETEDQRLERHKEGGNDNPPLYDGKVVSVIIDDKRAIEAPKFLFDEIVMH